MKSLFDLSFRYKIPVWGSLLIIVTVVAVSGSMVVRSYLITWRATLTDHPLTSSALI